MFCVFDKMLRNANDINDNIKRDSTSIVKEKEMTPNDRKITINYVKNLFINASDIPKLSNQQIGRDRAVLHRQMTPIQIIAKVKVVIQVTILNPFTIGLRFLYIMEGNVAENSILTIKIMVKTRDTEDST
uniref:Uncharacterized protein n=1 Tax=Strongyloides venezuelensis TaxID=75913 RepID=A0A0K0FMY0_STRVS